MIKKSDLDRLMSRVGAVPARHQVPFLRRQKDRMIKIQIAICHSFDITLEDLLSRTRVEPIITARHVAMYLCRELVQASYSQIAEAFARHDSSTAGHAVRQVEFLLGHVENFAAKCDKFRIAALEAIKEVA